MTRKHFTKKALLMSALSLLLCVSMLIGTTYAWFTDSVVSGSNVIKSGNLDIDVQYTLDGNNWNDLQGANNLFQKDLWEPGHTEVVVLKVENKGSLALKYSAGMNIINEIKGKTKAETDIVLSDILVVSTLSFAEAGIDPIFNIAAETIKSAFNSENGIAYAAAVPFKSGNVLREEKDLKPGAIEYIAIQVDMPETVGNEANHNGTNIPSIEFGINIFATQYTYEKDSFDDQYDRIATVSTEAELKTALEAGGNVLLAADIDLTQTITIPSDKTVKLDLNGKTITAPDVTFGTAICAIQNQGTLTVTGNGTIEGSYTALYSNGNLTIEGGNFVAANGFGALIDNIYGTEASAAVINGGTFTGLGIYNPTDVTINGGTFNVGRDPDGASDHLSVKMTLFVSPTFTGAPNTANVVLNGGIFNGDVYIYDDGITETVFVNNGATITGDVLDNG